MKKELLQSDSLLALTAVVLGLISGTQQPWERLTLIAVAVMLILLRAWVKNNNIKRK